MSSPIPDLSALQCIHAQAPATTTRQLTNWTIEEDISVHPSSSTHPHFDPVTGVYITPKDGIYLLKVQLIPIGGATLRYAHKIRKHVAYALKIEDPENDDQYLDVGSHNLGKMEHLRAGSKLSCMRMEGASGGECVRLCICCVQRKRKREEQVLSKKEMKRRRRAASRAVRVENEGSDDDVEESSDSEWEHGFDSDSTSDELPTSDRSVGNLAKRLKTIDAD